MATSVPQRIAVLGYGRFGRALTELLVDAGLQARALDPAVSIPAPLRAATPAELLVDAEGVFLAVPVHEFRAALMAIEPELRPTQLVMDVSSVKRGPVREMTEVLSRRVPWVATHPLFGPSSIALGERPLDAVVCPNELHPGAAATARALYELIGCRVFEQDAEDHDRLMAQTHALAFFVAKGMLDVGAAERLSFSPPSFRAMARTIEAVRTDAGHLFLAIQRDNPYAAEARQALLDALARVHEQLAKSAVAPPSADPFAIPDLGAETPELRETRDLIDEVDRELLRLLARRALLSRRAGKVKQERGGPLRDEARERSLLADRQRLARAYGLDERAVAGIFEAVLAYSRGLQRRDPNSGA